MKAGRVFRSQWVPKEPKPVVEPEDKRAAREEAAALGPGVEIKISLELLPAYLALHGLQPVGIREPKFPPRDGPGEAILLVKRMKKGME